MPLLTTSRVPAGFTETTAPANGITINYVHGGAGPTLVLLHGYPQTWYMWRKVLPALAEHFTVIAPDLRGAGGSDAPADGYGKPVLAEDVHQLLVGLDLANEVSVVGHDIGTMVAYAYAAAHRDSTSRLVLIDSPLADESLYEFPSLTAQGPGLWNFGFFTLRNGLPERMVAGREDAWVDGFVDWLEVVKGGVDEQAIARLSEDPINNSLLHTTCVATRLEAGHANNALPQSAKANLNCRILPGHGIEETRQTVIKIINDPKVSVNSVADTGDVETQSSQRKSFPPPPLLPEVMQPLEKVTQQMWPGIPVVPSMATGASDAVYTAPAGLPTYGVSGIALDNSDIRAHGKDERLPVKSFYDGLEFYYRYLKAVTQE